jgi:hypothetical protein
MDMATITITVATAMLLLEPVLLVPLRMVLLDMALLHHLHLDLARCSIHTVLAALHHLPRQLEVLLHHRRLEMPLLQYV